jgi:hypothetical protein
MTITLTQDATLSLNGSTSELYKKDTTMTAKNGHEKNVFASLVASGRAVAGDHANSGGYPSAKATPKATKTATPKATK